jgi:hypothetical protein
MNNDYNHAEGIAKILPGQLAAKLAAIGVSPKKAVEYVAMFTVLTVIYYCYFVHDAKANACPADETITLSQLGILTLKFIALAGWPFALMAALDAGWRSKDAGNVFLAAYLATNVLWYHKTHCAFCIFAASFRIIPYVFCALVAHSLGALRHRFSRDE